DGDERARLAPREALHLGEDVARLVVLEPVRKPLRALRGLPHQAGRLAGWLVAALRHRAELVGQRAEPLSEALLLAARLAADLGGGLAEQVADLLAHGRTDVAHLLLSGLGNLLAGLLGVLGDVLCLLLGVLGHLLSLLLGAARRARTVLVGSGQGFR